MITIVGTNHTFDISKSLEFIIKYIWPDAVLVELDETRYNFINTKNEPGERNELKKASWMYRSIIRRQSKTARCRKSYVGNDMFTVIKIAQFIGADVKLIDMDTQSLIKDIWTEMPIHEKIRYFLSTVIGSIDRRKNMPIEQFLEREEKMTIEMRHKYPTIVRKLIDERDTHMTKQIKNYAQKFHNVVVVVGDAHVTGIVSLLKNYSVKEIRFRDIMDKNRFNSICSEIWNYKGENNES
ncbi:MAG: TraB/GumN family protein [archaeon]|nr:TraB/GumN family protein [archaeon]